MKHTFLLFALCVTTSLCAQDYKNPSLSAETRAHDLISRLTLDEKAKLMEHESKAIERLGIPQFNWWNEALHGVGRNGTATVFPITMAMSATFDDALVQRAYSAVSDEARAKNNLARREGPIKIYQSLSFYSPNINIFRDPRWGRGQETWGEDPYLTSKMGMAVVRGLQGAEGNEGIEYGRNGNYRKLLACAKHFVVHSGPEWNRHQFNIENLPPRLLWETYMPAFKALVTEADVQEVMCAYQRFDGEPCCGNSQLLNTILRKEWDFKGLVTSDCWAVNDFWEKNRHNTSPNMLTAISTAVTAGTDVECGNTYRFLVDAVKEGKISEAKVDESLFRLLKARFELGDFDSDELVPWKSIGPEVIASPEHRQMALEAGHKSIVLLQNKRNILPLKPSTKVAVIGPNANDSIMMWGNYNGFPRHTVTILEGLQKQGNVVAYMKGCELAVNPDSKKKEQMARDYGHDTALLIQTEDASNTTHADILAAVKDAEVVIFVGGISPRLEGEEMKMQIPGFMGGDRTSLELPQVQRDVLKMLRKAGKHIVMINCSGSAVALEPETSTCDAIIQAWYGGESGGDALADVIYGKVNPSGRLPITFYRNTEQLPDYESYDMTGRTYRYMNQRPLWPFGFGLSYSKVKYGKPSFDGNKLSVNLTNQSKVDCEEVVQVYLHKKGDSEGPVRTLRAFKRVSVPAGKIITAEIGLTDQSFEWWDESTNTMRPLSGTYELMVGASSQTKDLQTITITR